MKRFHPILIVFLGFSWQAQADVYKCRQPDGRTEISSLPCASGSSTVRTVAEDVVPAAVREKAERDADRRREQVERIEAERRTKDKEEREITARQPQAEKNPIETNKVEECLRTVSRMTLDASRRAELEASCLSTGTIPPITVVVPVYYPRGGHVSPPHPPKPKPLPAKDPAKPGYYSSPDKYKVP